MSTTLEVQRGLLDEALAVVEGGQGVEMAMQWAYGLTEDSRYAQLCADWHKLKQAERRALSLDQFCREHEIEPLDFLKEITGLAVQYSGFRSQLVSALMLPALVEKGFHHAMKGTKGEQERHRILQNHGHRVVPKGAQAVFVNQVAAMAQANSGETTGLPPFEEETLAMSRTLKGQMVDGQLLEEGEPE